MLGLMRARRGFAAMVIARDGEDADMRRRSFEIAQLQGFAGAIDAETLAVPQPEHALVFGFPEPAQLLRTANGGRREFFVQARHEPDIMFADQNQRAP